LSNSRDFRSLKKTGAEVVYICNLFTEPGSTHDYTASDHVQKLIEYSVPIDTVLVHKNGVNENVLSTYAKEGKFPVQYDKSSLSGLKIIEGNFVVRDEVPLRHSDETGEVLMELLNSL